MEMPSAGGISLWTDRSGTFCLLASISTSAVALIHCSAALACLWHKSGTFNVFIQKQQISISTRLVLAGAARNRNGERLSECLEDKAGFVLCRFSEWTVCGQTRLVSTCWTAKNSHIPAVLLTSLTTVQI